MYSLNSYALHASPPLTDQAEWNKIVHLARMQLRTHGMGFFLHGDRTAAARNRLWMAQALVDGTHYPGDFAVRGWGDRITGVLDWGCALVGDLLYDLAWFCFWQPWYPAWQRIDFRAEYLRHCDALGLDVPHFDQRLRACQIHIGLAGQAYQAYAGDWTNLPGTALRTLDVAS